MIWRGIIGKGFSADEFDAYVKTVAFAVWKPEFAVLHNTGAPKLAQWHSVSGEQRMANLEHYYRDECRWPSGPHLFVADDLIWAFTPLDEPGTHAPSWNMRSWGVEMVGDYSSEPFSPEVRMNAIRALAALHSRLGLDPRTLRLHKEDPDTTHKDCPGKNVDKLEMIAAVAARMNMKQSAATAKG